MSNQPKSSITLKNVKVHNLKGVDLTIKANQLIVFTGVSGSGKSSLAFDTLFVEGQRRYIESLSTFARRQIGEMGKPDLEYAEGITPTISIEQKTSGKNPRSTVGTITEIYDYMRVLYARIGEPHCPISHEPVTPQSRERIIKTIQNMANGKRVIFLSPFARNKKAEFIEDFQDLLRKGFMRARVDGTFIDLSEKISLDGTIAHDVDVVIDRLNASNDNASRIAEAITLALAMGSGVMSVLLDETNEETLFSMHAFSPKSGLSYSALEPSDFSFNSPTGMCTRCFGLGLVNEFDLNKIIDPNLSIAEDCCAVASSYKTVRYGNIYDNLARIAHFNIQTPWKKLSVEAKQLFLHGTEKKWTKMHFVHPETHATWSDHVQWRGVLYEAHSRFAEAKSDLYRNKMQKLMKEQVCPACQGGRLKPYPAATLLKGKAIASLTDMTIEGLFKFFNDLSLSDTEHHIANELIKEIQERLKFLLEVGLGYLTLNRTSPTLSGGESQRVRLASQIGSGLVGITYILDEPSIGLHPRDNHKLIKTLKHLKNIGNTVVVVEHDEETILEADHIVDFGPGPGSRGGEIVVDGSLQDLLKSPNSLTGGYLSGRLSIPIPTKRRKANDKQIIIEGATHHNLKNVTLKIPTGIFIAVTGVSGSGKSSLISDILFPALDNHLHGGEHPVGAHKKISGIECIDKVIEIDQSPIGRNPRSNPATYTKVFDEIRDLFTQLPESRARGYKPGRFSFNVKEGSCRECGGMGQIKIDMDFMEDAWMDCPRCKGRRFDEETLSVLYKGKNIYDILEMEVAVALAFFANMPAIFHKLKVLEKVGMEYIKLGQSSTTLSGGEAQRIKLAKELARPQTGNTLYIFDEPTTGLHFHDIKHLLEVFHELVERGNTLVVIEHNMDVVKTADWIIDIGPEGGDAGGQVIAKGTPEKIATLNTPTGEAIKLSLKSTPALKKAQMTKAKKEIAHAKEIQEITVIDAEQHNLKQVSVSIPRNRLTVCTGPSGSGKTSLAFDTIYAEGQRRYIESLSPYARQFVKQMPKPKVASIEGLSPAIAIEQKAHAGNPRSTVGTMTECYDYLRLLFAHLGIPHCPETGEIIQSISKEFVVGKILALPDGERVQILAKVEAKKYHSVDELLTHLQPLGFLKLRLNGQYFDIDSKELLQSFDKKRKNDLFLVIDRLKVAKQNRLRLLEAVESAASIGEGQLIVAKDDIDIPFNLSFAVASSGKSYPPIVPQTFAFNNALGMCLDCQGLGYQYGANLIQMGDQMGNVQSHTPTTLLKFLWKEKTNSKSMALAAIFFKEEKISQDEPLSKMPSDKLHLLMNGSAKDKLYQGPNGLQFSWPGINCVFAKIGKGAKAALKDPITPLLDELECPSCEGTRLNPLARHVTIADVSITDLCHMAIDKALDFMQNLKLSTKESKLLGDIKKQVANKLSFLASVGLHYISLDRKAPTLSGGESQRIRLARQLGSGLTGVLYVIDEPTIGLHPFDNDQLNSALQELKNSGNTVLIVEHDLKTIETADYILDFGPASGAKGGHITARGTLQEIKDNPDSLTGAYLSSKISIPIPKKRHQNAEMALSIKGAKLHNLKNLSLKLPLGLLTCLTGVSGSGKSTLLNQLILPAIHQGVQSRQDGVTYKECRVEGIAAIDKLLSIDQNPIGHTVRSDVGTYVDILVRMRDFFTSLPLARTKGLQGKHFSYNHRRGMCSACYGLGYKKVEMHFLPPVKVVCEDCKGMRLNPVSLEVQYAGKNFGQYLDMTVDDARAVFANHPRITRPLDTLISVGLGYLKLGQEMVSLSGGEAQRIKLSKELSKRSTGRTLYLMDEPTTGLHSDDIKKLLSVLQRLVDKGNTIVIIEHNLDVIKNADYIIELGPKAGDAGGFLVFKGTPEEIAKNKKSKTAPYLK